MAKKPKVWPAKVGTVPMLIILRRNYRLEPGKRLEWREDKHGSKWHIGYVDDYDREVDRLFISR